MKRNVGLCILFTFITCGVYGIYWIYKLTEEANSLSGDSSTTPGLTLLLIIVSCGIYSWYWAYKMGKQLQVAQEAAGLVSSDDSVLYLVLFIFQFGIIAQAIMQSNVNKIIDSGSNYEY